MNRQVEEIEEVIDFIETSIKGIPVLFTREKLNRGTVPKQLLCYEISYADEDEIDYDVLSRQIRNSFAGTVLSLMELDLKANELYKLKKNKDLIIDDSSVYSSVNEFMVKHG